jgi:hypothetical protein
MNGNDPRERVLAADQIELRRIAYEGTRAQIFQGPFGTYPVVRTFMFRSALCRGEVARLGRS